MADHEQVALRLLEPRWTTIVGTVRQFQDMAVDRRFRVRDAWGSMGAVPDGPRPDDHFDGWRRLWLHRDGRARLELFEPGEPPWVTAIDQGGGRLVELTPGAPPSAKAHWQDPIVWMARPAAALAGHDVELADDVEYAGRVATELVLTPSRRRGPFGGMSALGMPLGDQSRLLVDV